jgi:uncharacterized membrane protein (GlpM family)
VLDLLLRFAIGAAVVGLAVWISDNVDARVGGVLSAIPKTSAVSLFVIAYEHGGAFAAEAAVSSMYGLAAVVAYATAFAVVPRIVNDPHPLWVFALAFAVYLLAIAPYLAGLDARLGLLANVALVIAAYLASTRVVAHARSERSRSVEPSAGAVGVRQHLLRYVLPAIVGGSLVLAATLAADRLGPVVGGIASVFPANVTTVLVTGAILLDPYAAFDQAAGVPDGVAAAGAFLLGLYALLPVAPIALAGVVGYLAWGATAWGLGRVRGPARPIAE